MDTVHRPSCDYFSLSRLCRCPTRPPSFPYDLRGFRRVNPRHRHPHIVSWTPGTPPSPHCPTVDLDTVPSYRLCSPTTSSAVLTPDVPGPTSRGPNTSDVPVPPQSGPGAPVRTLTPSSNKLPPGPKRPPTYFPTCLPEGELQGERLGKRILYLDPVLEDEVFRSGDRLGADTSLGSRGNCKEIRSPRV